jgi:2-furoate---CoA ligase
MPPSRTGLTVDTCVRRACTRYDAVVALVDGSRALTYRELGSRTDELAAELLALGLRPRDTVVACMRNGLELSVAYLALQRIGAVHAPVNFRLSLPELQHCVDLVRPAVVLFDAETVRSHGENVELGGAWRICVDYEARDGPLQLIATSQQPRSAPAGPASPGPRPDDLSLVLFTSGTTGKPKGVARSHAAEVAATLVNLAAFPWRLGVRTLGVMPLYHTMGIRILLSSLFLGGTCVLQQRWRADEALHLVEEHEVSALFLVPTMYYDLLGCAELGERAVCSVESLGFAGMVLREEIVSQLAPHFPRRAMVNVYGCSELYCLSYSDRTLTKPGTVGPGAFHQELRVIPEHADSGEEALAEAGAIGQIVARADAPDAFDAYWDAPDATARARHDGWYFTGDLGYRDRDGDLFVVGRADDTVVSGGENVHPVEVEAALCHCPGVAEVCVLGLPDERLGDAVAAFVVRADPELTEERVLDYCATAGTLSSFKRPRRIVFVDEIPKSSVGKVRRHVLREAYTLAGTESS